MWPFNREAREAGEAGGVVDWQGGGTPADAPKVAKLAVAANAARIWATGLTLAEIEPADGLAAMLLTTPVREMIGRELLLRGESLWLIESAPEGVRAVPAMGSAYGGDADPASWVYEVSIPGPGRMASRTVMAGAVLHFRIGADPWSPWRGRSPLVAAGLDADALAALAGQLRAAAGAPHGWILPVGAHLDETTRSKLGKAIKATMGGLLPWSQNDRIADLTPKGFGLLASRIDTGLQSVRRDIEDAISAAAGIPPDLLRAGGGISSREAWRQCGVFLHGVGKLIAGECSAKLGEAVALDFAELASADIRMRAASFKMLTDAGMSAELAARVAGFEASPATAAP